MALYKQIDFLFAYRVLIEVKAATATGEKKKTFLMEKNSISKHFSKRFFFLLHILVYINKSMSFNHWDIHSSDAIIH